MKYNIKSAAMACTVLLACALQANAQEFKEGESISQQLKNGTVPGLKFGPVTRPARVARQASDPNEGKESQVSQIRKGTLKGVQFAGGGAAGSSRRSMRPAARQAAAGTLPSDQKASERKPVLPGKPAAIPTQDGATEPKESKVLPLPAKTALPAKQ